MELPHAREFSDCPPWTGVTCDENGNVTAVVLEGLGLGGELKFHTLIGLGKLKNLSLAGNGFTGRVEPTLGTMTSLQHLDLSGNGFYGPIPERISGLWDLKHLNLSANKFKGGFPRGFNNLQQLKVLDLHSNQLWGSIGDLVQELRNLEYVDLSVNEFFGSISLPLENISSLANTVHHLNLSHNKLNGGFFKGDAIALFRNLEVLDLGYNQINGELPSFGSLPSLRVLRLGNNQLFGSIPEELFETSIPIVELDLSNNGFTGSLVGINSTQLVLNLSSNSLSGALPATVKSCLAIDLSKNMISGDVSTMQNWEAHLEFIDMSSNELSGSFPKLSSHFQSLTTINLRNNSIVGTLPPILVACPRLSTVDVSSNELSGPIPASFFGSRTLLTLNLSGNHLIGPISLGSDHVSELLYLPSSPMIEYLDLSELFVRKVAKELDKLRNDLLILPKGMPTSNSVPDHVSDLRKNRPSKSSNIKVAIILASVGAAFMIVFVLLAYHRSQLKDFHRRSGLGGSISAQREIATEVVHREVATTSASMDLLDNNPATSGRKSSSDSPLSSSPRFIEAREQPVMLDVYSPDRLAGELFFLDASMAFTAEEELSRAPAEVLGRSSHGTLYKATLDSGHMLTVKWLRVGLVKHKKEFAREVKRIGSIRHPSIVPLRAYYWGPREQERLLLADYIHGDSLALHLYAGPEYEARLTDYSLHRLMTPAGIAEQILNMGALGYRAPELSSAAKPVPSFKADVYAFGVILMELLTRRSAGDIISGQSGAVDLTDWVRLCDQEGRGRDCIDRDIASGEEPSKAMDDLLAISLKCILLRYGELFKVADGDFLIMNSGARMGFKGPYYPNSHFLKGDLGSFVLQCVRKIHEDDIPGFGDPNLRKRGWEHLLWHYTINDAESTPRSFRLILLILPNIPFGLVRSGVAIDHPETKVVVNQFSRVLNMNDVFLWKCLSWIAHFSVSFCKLLLLAYGAESDRVLGIPGEIWPGHSTTENLFGGNGHPDCVGLNPDLKSTDTAVILGQVLNLGKTDGCGYQNNLKTLDAGYSKRALDTNQNQLMAYPLIINK
uniref:Protein kinase domain-containing protein n=1 Tax=Cannabis sativa TaxID=3483 RepID=A0A803QRK4_CANSA